MILGKINGGIPFANFLTKINAGLKKTFYTKDDISSNTKIALAALLIAVFIIFDRYLNIRPTMFIRLSLATIPVMLAGHILGIKWAVLVGALGDMLGALFLMPFGTYFFGFTFNWMIAGFIFGLLLYRKRNLTNAKLLVNIIVSSILVYISVQVFLGSYFLWGWFFRAGFSYWYIVGFRAWTFAIVLAIQIPLAWTLFTFLKKPMNKFLVIDDDEEDEESPIENAPDEEKNND